MSGVIWIHSGHQHRTKSDKGRWVPMTQRLASAMRQHFARLPVRHLQRERTSWVFHHTR